MGNDQSVFNRLKNDDGRHDSECESKKIKINMSPILSYSRIYTPPNEIKRGDIKNGFSKQVHRSGNLYVGRY